MFVIARLRVSQRRLGAVDFKGIETMPADAEIADVGEIGSLPTAYRN
jgi:hypothetical protein